MTFQSTDALNLQCHALTDAEGRFQIDTAPPGRLQLNGRIMINDHAWTQEPLEKFSLKPGQELQIEIRAPASTGPQPGIQPARAEAGQHL